MRQEKQLLLDEIQEMIQKYGSFVITRYSGIDANTVSDFRRDIAQMGGCVEVVPKRIFLKAAETAGLPFTREELEGHISLVFSGQDALDTTKRVFKFSKDTGKALVVIGGHIDGQLLKAADVEILSKLPGKAEMQAQLLSVFEAPMSQTLAVMHGLLTCVMHCMDNKSKEKSGE